MNWFYNLKIAKKLLLSFLVVIALTAVLGIFSILQLTKVNQASTEIATNWLPSIRLGLQMQASLARFRVSELQHILSNDEVDMLEAEKVMQTRLGLLRKDEAAYEALVSEPDEKIIFPQFKQTSTNIWPRART